MAARERYASVREEVGGLAHRFELPHAAPDQLSCLLDLLATDPLAATSVRDPAAILRDHLADSLVALELPEVRESIRFADIGSGAGLPGLPLAIALPRARFTLIESRQPKTNFIEHAARACELGGVEVVHARAEEFSVDRAFEVVLARALAPLDVVAEYAAPLMALGGTLVVWRGSRDDEAEAAAARAGRVLGLELGRVVPVKPYPDVRNRHLYLMVKVSPTPDRFPRRPGVARRQPLG